MWYAENCIVHKSGFTLPEIVTFYLRSSLEKEEKIYFSVCKKWTDL